MQSNSESEQQSYTLQFSHGTTTLNSEQFQIVTGDPFEHQRILAAAGSGKTTTIAARIAWLLTNTNAKPDQIVLLTFSRNAAREMFKRVRRLVGPVNLWAGTFHALANTILKQFPSGGGEGQGQGQQLFFIDELPVRWMQWMRTDRGRRWVGRLRYIVVDEFQDINAIQWRLLETMRHIGARIILVGDDAQNIYTWRGSSVSFLLNVHTVVKGVRDYQLRQNYRSTEAIIAVANRVMRGIPTLPWKEHMIAVKPGGIKPDCLFFWRLSDELGFLAQTIHSIRASNPALTIAVLARNNIDLYRTEEVLIQNGIQTRFLASERGDDEEPVLGSNEYVVDLATFHGSKGLEWDVTFLISLSDDTLPSKKTPHEIIGERRLFYVAVTRARKRMFLTYHGNERCLTRFVREIGYQHITFHGLAKYALSEVESGGAHPSLQALLDSLDGDQWQTIRSLGLLPWKETDLAIPITSQSYFPNGESWRLPHWADSRDFEAFLRLWMKRCILALRGWTEPYKDPLRERMIFTVRIFQEDCKFWLQWREAFDQMVRYFFKDLQRMPPADYGDIAKWAEEQGLAWTQTELVNATSILAKIRGQLRPLRFISYSLDEMTIGPTRCVVPTEYRIDVLRSWRRFVSPDVHWKSCLLDTWRLACLEQVAEGRHAGLFRAGAMQDLLETCVPFLESLETALQNMLQEEGRDADWSINPEVAPEGLHPVSSDCLIGRRLVRISGDTRPDMYMWTETLLTAYLFVACGLCRPITQIQILHPFHGILWTHSPVDLHKAKQLYEVLLTNWNQKTSYCA